MNVTEFKVKDENKAYLSSILDLFHNNITSVIPLTRLKLRKY